MLSDRKFYTQDIAIRGPLIVLSIVRISSYAYGVKLRQPLLISRSRSNLLRPLVEKGGPGADATLWMADLLARMETPPKIDR